MRYGIAVFPSKKVQDVANSYRKRYDPHYALIPPHITVKEPFEAEESEIEEKIIPELKEIAKNTEPFSYGIYKVSSFSPVTNTIYLKVEPSEEIFNLNEQLHTGSLPDKKDFKFVPHITIAQKLSDDEFFDVYGSLSMNKFDIQDNVGRFQLLYQLENGAWSVYETFRLGGRDKHMEIRQVASPQEKDDAFHVRRVVFVDEQNVPEDLEIDEHDDTAVHLVGYEQDEPIAAARLRFVGDYGKLERICVKRPYRGKRYGKEMILFMESLIEEHTYQASKLNAQTHAEAFYQSLGYETVSGEFMDAGIPHVTMTKTL